MSVLVLAFALAGAHCSSNEPSSGGPLASSPTPAAAATPNEGLSADEAARLLPGVDTSMLSPQQRSALHELAADTFCPCSNQTLSSCLRAQSCPAAVREAELAKRLLLAGQSPAQTLLRVETYYGAFPEARRAPVDADGPIKGAPQAKVTIVEFSDFQCPACKAAHPVFDQLVKKYPNDVRVVFKNYPLPQHPFSEPAARAGVYAARQGRFWEFADGVFARQANLDMSGIDAAARDAGLDVAAMRRAIDEDPSIAAKVEADRQLGNALQIGGTPTIYVNGRQHILPPSLEYLSWAVDDELQWLANGRSWTAAQK